MTVSIYANGDGYRHVTGTDPTGSVSVTLPSQPEPAPVDCNEEVVVADRKEMANGSGLALSDPGKKMQ
jgi:hypothetical protein